MATQTGEDSAAVRREFLSPDEVSILLPYATGDVLALWRLRHVGPAYRKRGRTIMYAVDDVRAWIAGR